MTQAQLGALGLGVVGVALVGVSLGLVEWRVWTFPRAASVWSGRAWIGLWRVCFHSHEEASPGFLILRCRSFRLTDSFVPVELASAQVLVLLALGAALLGTSCGLYALRNAVFGIRRRTCLAFRVGGVLILAAAILALVPLLWNVVSVSESRTVAFPPEFDLPEAPAAQQVGGAVWAGLVGVALLLVTAVIFVSYKLPRERVRRSGRGEDNPAFEWDDVWL